MQFNLSYFSASSLSLLMKYFIVSCSIQWLNLPPSLWRTIHSDGFAFLELRAPQLQAPWKWVSITFRYFHEKPEICWGEASFLRAKPNPWQSQVAVSKHLAQPTTVLQNEPHPDLSHTGLSNGKGTCKRYPQLKLQHCWNTTQHRPD